MKLLKILLCGLLLVLPVLAEEAEDRQTATSLHYVSHELDTRQNKLSTGSNKALTYTNAAGGVEQRTVKENLNGGTTDTSLPQVNAVNAGLNQKQNDIAPIDDHTAVTYTENLGEIGQKGIYQTDGTYAEQSDNLIDAKTFNAALKNGLDSEFVCTGYKPGTDLCWLWQIHSNMLPDDYTRLEYVKNNSGTYINTGIIPDVDDMEFEIEVQPSSVSWYILQERRVDGGPIRGISGSASGSTILFGWNGTNSLLQSSITRNTSHTYYVKATAKNGVATLYVRDLTDGTTDTKTTTYTFNNTQTVDDPICVWGNTAPNYVSGDNYIHYAKIKKSGQLVMNYIPATYNNTNGFYDTISGTFKTATTGSIVAGPEMNGVGGDIYIPQNQTGQNGD